MKNLISDAVQRSLERKKHIICDNGVPERDILERKRGTLDWIICWIWAGCEGREENYRSLRSTCEGKEKWKKRKEDFRGKMLRTRYISAQFFVRPL